MKRFISYVLAFLAIITLTTFYAPKASAQVGSMTLPVQWNAVTDAYGYKVYYRKGMSGDYVCTDAVEGPSPIDVGDVTTYTLSGLDGTQPYYVKIVPYDSYGTEGPTSTPVRSYQITGITSTTPDGTYYTGESINITLNFIEQLTLLDAPMYVETNTGQVLEIQPFTGQYSVSCTYVVAPGDSGTLDVTSVYIDAGATLVHTNTGTPVCNPPIGNSLISVSTLNVASNSLTAPENVTINCSI